MFTVDFAKLPSSMNNMAGSALKRLSAAVGYNMTCSSQEEVEKQLPEKETSEQTPVQTGAIKTYEWLTWNIPRIMYLIMAGEVPEYAEDALKACDLIRNMDKS